MLSLTAFRSGAARFYDTMSHRRSIGAVVSPIPDQQPASQHPSPPSPDSRDDARPGLRHSTTLDHLHGLARPISEFWLKAMDSWIPDRIRRQGPEEQRRARLALSVVSFCALLSGVSLLIEVKRGTPAVTFAGIGLTVAMLSLFPLMKRTGSNRLVGNLMVLCYFTFVAVVTIMTGTTAPIGRLAAPAVPLLAFLLCGLRAGLAWSLLTLGLLAGLMIALGTGIEFPVRVDPAMVPRWTLSGSIVITIGTGLIALTFESLRRRALADAEQARRQTEDAQQRRIESEERFRHQLEALVEQRTRELEGSRAQLIQSQRLASVGTLAAGVAHQINNPIGSILASAEYALLYEEDPEISRRTILEEIVEQARRCGRIVRSVLQFSRDETSEKWRDDLGDVVARSCKLAGSHASASGVEIDLQLPSTPIMVEMNPIEMEQVILNLLHNAIQSGGTKIEVRIESNTADMRARIQVRDDGCGIEDDVLPRIFDPFFTTRLSDGGTGLGLSMAHGIVGSHGGRMQVESELGRGTTLIVELPPVE
jgi:signal transduction histidine kinase